MLNRFDAEMDNTVNEQVVVDHGTVQTVVDVKEYKPSMFQVIVSKVDLPSESEDEPLEFNQTEMFFDEEQLVELFDKLDDIRRKISIRRQHKFVEEIRTDINARADKQENLFKSDTDHVNLQAPNLYREIIDGDTIKTKMRSSKDYCLRFYATLCNNGLRKGTHDTGYSWRSTGALVADILGEGDYLDWYCSGNEGRVDEEVEADLKEIGWVVESDYYDDYSPTVDKQLKLDTGE